MLILAAMRVRVGVEEGKKRGGVFRKVKPLDFKIFYHEGLEGA